MPDKIIRLHEPTFGEEEILAACEQMRSTHVTMGQKTREFEKQCAERFSTNYAVMCNSGSSANLLAVAALSNPAWPGRLLPGDEVIVPALSWATSVWPLIQHGLIPVFVDCDPLTYNINVKKLKEAVSPKTRAIMRVHVYGNPCEMSEIKDIADANALLIIGDCCEAMGAQYGGVGIEYLADISTVSFYYSHHITTFEGGMALTSEFEFAELMRILRAHGWSREAHEKQAYADEHSDIDPRFLFVNIGYNLRPTEVQAVIGMKQLPKLDEIVANRRFAHFAIKHRLDRFERVLQFQKEQEESEASWFGFGIILRDTPFPLKEITTFLQSRGIETRPIIAGNMAKQPALKMYPHRVSGSLENCDAIMQKGFAIGCHQAITQDDIDYIGECFYEFMKDKI